MHVGKEVLWAVGGVGLLGRCIQQCVRGKDRGEQVWTQTTEDLAGKDRPPVLQTDAFSSSISQEHGHCRGTLKRESVI